MRESKFPWTYLSAKQEKLSQIKFDYFDGDDRCDVIVEINGRWHISSGGTADWAPFGDFSVPLSEVQFGVFGIEIASSTPHRNNPTTHAFRRPPAGEWLITNFVNPNWQHVQSSSIAMDKLRFGDFTGDGITDVLAVVGGH